MARLRKSAPPLFRLGWEGFLVLCFPTHQKKGETAPLFSPDCSREGRLPCFHVGIVRLPVPQPPGREFLLSPYGPAMGRRVVLARVFFFPSNGRTLDRVSCRALAGKILFFLNPEARARSLPWAPRGFFPFRAQGQRALRRRRPLLSRRSAVSA